eukprot:837068-Rhodomonas_salina.1
MTFQISLTLLSDALCVCVVCVCAVCVRVPYAVVCVSGSATRDKSVNGDVSVVASRERRSIMTQSSGVTERNPNFLAVRTSLRQ